jgi:hypothetical protein
LRCVLDVEVCPGLGESGSRLTFGALDIWLPH